ncbi:uncharacterized protein PHALS_15338 [Plasmopara halstedii]|uniref:Uncharacterized protein n=1 Tax=Plasmopara halstedii TaxID=4781 RepID=A0A0P1ADW6_PLAHL|nr:uncharacterized protein PHALS_15338 [Plasmopara halstedii]CEG38809.1 hypothetical protein PHALS_15338 [Plasmopara halstedii]|eukprot:XP_024575178.1 hypothetical protein PHALS_15338 [Plasmopara halstedii]
MHVLPPQSAQLTAACADEKSPTTPASTSSLFILAYYWELIECQTVVCETVFSDNREILQG